jgi:hypothetical protein
MSFSFYDANTQKAIDLNTKRSLEALEEQDLFSQQGKQSRLDANKYSIEKSARQRDLDKIVDDGNIEIAKLKAKKRLTDALSGNLNTAQEDEALMSDFQRRKQIGDYDLDNQIKAWGAANKYRMSEADQSNVAQKDRLGMQLDTQKSMQQRTIDQENRLRSDDNRRAIDGFKLSI